MQHHPKQHCQRGEKGEQHHPRGREQHHWSFGLGDVTVFDKWDGNPFWVMLLSLLVLLCRAVSPLLLLWGAFFLSPFGAVLDFSLSLVGGGAAFLLCPSGRCCFLHLLLVGAACFLPLPCVWCCCALLLQLGGSKKVHPKDFSGSGCHDIRIL